MDLTAPDDGQYPEEDLLTTLPNELLAHIIKLPPVREICRLRGQNRHVRSFIDANQRLLVKDVIKHHRDRIRAEHRLLTDLADCDIFDAMQRYYSHYGHVGHPTVNSIKSRAAASTLKIKWNESKSIDELMSTPGLLYCFSKFQRAKTPKRRIRWRRKLQGPRIELIPPVLEQSGLEALRKKLQSEPAARHPAYPDVPSVFHTTRFVLRAPWITPEPEEIPGVHDVQDALFHKVLDLPLLDSDCSLAFCSHNVRTPVALQMIASGLSTVLQEADVLEDIYIWYTAG